MTFAQQIRRLTSHRTLRSIGIFAAVMAAVPLVLSTPYALSTMILIAIYSLVAIGLCILVGYAGQMSLGQSAYFGLGAYGSAILTTRLAMNPWLAMIVAAGITAVVAYVMGIPILRLRGHYLALGTLAFGAIIHIIATEWKAYTGGPTGLPGIPRLRIGGIPVKGDLAYYYLSWAFTIAGLWIALNLVDSRFGRALKAIRDSEEAAQSLGVAPRAYKLRALTVSAIYASVAGSLYAHYMIFISPDACSFDASIRLVLMIAVGGLASIWGAPFGTASVILLTVVLREIVPLFTRHGSGEYQIIAYGGMLVAIMIFWPQGLTVTISRAWRNRRPLAALQRRMHKRARRV